MQRDTCWEGLKAPPPRLWNNAFKCHFRTVPLPPPRPLPTPISGISPFSPRQPLRLLPEEASVEIHEDRDRGLPPLQPLPQAESRASWAQRRAFVVEEYRPLASVRE